MALSYQTEYRVGDRGRISRSYTGYQAFLAIFFDLIFGLVFELVTFVIGLALRLVCLTFQICWAAVRKSWGTLVAMMAALVYAVTLPLAALHHAVNRFRSQMGTGRATEMAMKPDWALSRDL